MTGLKFAIERAKDKAHEAIACVKCRNRRVVDVEKIAKHFNVEVRETDFEDGSVAGFLRRKEDGSSLIVVNKRDAPQRKRFTIAHELGHFLLHTREMLHVDRRATAALIHFRNDESSKATRMNEIEANQFAAELLMPSKEVMEDVKKIINSRQDVSLEDVVNDLADAYQVSPAAMSIKLGALSH